MSSWLRRFTPILAGGCWVLTAATALAAEPEAAPRAGAGFSAGQCAGRGHAGVAVRASSAMSGIVSPVGIDGVEYEDGDEFLPVPVTPARQAGARFVIAVDVSARPGSTPVDASPALRDRDTRRRARIEPEVALADFLIHPDLDYRAGPFRSYFVSSRARGEAHARARLPALLAALDERHGGRQWAVRGKSE